MRVALAAGETSGDALGAELIKSIKARAPECEFFGIAGPGMVAAGCDPWCRTEELSVMGLTEVLRHLPRLLRLRRAWIERLLAVHPDVYIGIDSPDFNLPVEARLKAKGIATVQYVSPQVWAWRQSRVGGIRKAADLVLCLLPFEAEFYSAHGVKAIFVGHPLADQIPANVDSRASRDALGIARDTSLVAVLPGSRRSEVARLARPFMQTMRWLTEQRSDLAVVVALSSETMRDVFVHETAGIDVQPPPVLVTGRAREVLVAADVVLTASGTASLEATLLKRPMVVAYRISPVTLGILNVMGLKSLEHFSLPNLLAGRRLVPEYAQKDVRPQVMGPALLGFLDGEPSHGDWYDGFAAIHEQLKRDASTHAARAVIDLLEGHGE